MTDGSEAVGKGNTIHMTIDGRDYVALPADEYRELCAGAGRADDGVAWARAELGRTLRAAREHAGLTQAALAKRLKRSQPLVARAEGEESSVGERYVASVLRACKLPADWTPKNQPSV